MVETNDPLKARSKSNPFKGLKDSGKGRKEKKGKVKDKVKKKKETRGKKREASKEADTTLIKVIILVLGTVLVFTIAFG